MICRGMNRKICIFIAWIFLLFVALPASAQPPDASRCPQDCSQIEDDEARLRCYDEIFGRSSPLSESKSAEIGKEAQDSEDSYLTRLWEMDSKYPFMTHRPNYILPASYNSSPHKTPFEEAASPTDVNETEVKFQISIKSRLWANILEKDMDLWFGYTQRSFWQLYNFENSAPFRETNYEPELLLNFRTNFDVPGFKGLKGRFVNLGINHQSNGRSEPLSRSWNRIVGSVGLEKMNFVLEKDNFVLLLKAWYRIPESDEDDDNPGIEDYMGPGELWGYYFWNRQRLTVMLRNNLDFDGNRGAVQLEWSFPLFEKLGGYIQYFNGYGESLLDYNHSVNRIGIGFMLNDWE